MQVASAFDMLNPAWEAERYVQKAHLIRAGKKRRLATASQTGKGKQLRRLVDGYLTNPQVKMSALYKAGVRRPNVREWHAEARSLDLFCAIQETVYWWPEPKRSGSFRPVCSLPQNLKAAHNMISDVISAMMALPPFIYNVKDRGRDKLALQLLAVLRQGFNCYRIYDVQDCFQNVCPDAVYQLKLPRRVITHALDMRNLKLQPVAIHDATQSDPIPWDTIIDTAVESGPAGLMQGSPASNLILAYLLQAMPQPANERGRLFLYGDDLIAVAKTEETADRVEQSLLQFFEQPSIGPLPLQKKAAGTGCTFEFLGYEFHRNTMKNTWSIGLSQRNWDELTRDRHLEVLRLHLENPSGIFLDDMRSVRRKLLGHAALSDPEAILRALYDIGPDLAEIQRARSKWGT
ncbi:reverse transcriptase domain-containing protein [Leisingera sp. ANG-DT]|uniref:reverse transcriptase domain-containing protein n=1 Tax=Leisingera sp. ANG-DT TaxID=1577897 RepID=UPI00057E7EBA|nr:reverse transcriptase domain-containing protein [Leisingera sp. ANG-DT]KIC18509.1 hypothetical protein RA21_04430 [Leisingera sp. ANG-DT]